MFQLYLAKKNKTFDVLQPLNLWIGGLLKCELKQKLGEPAVLNLVVNRNLGDLWLALRDTDDIAIRLIDSTSNLDIAFIKQEDSQVDTETGSSFQFVSFIKAIKNKKPYYDLNQAISGFVFGYITNLDDQIVWAGIGTNQLINYNVGSKNNFEILQELCKKAGFSYREDGFSGAYYPNVNTQTLDWVILPKVLMGDFKQMPVSRIITNHSPYNLTDSVIIEEPKRKNKVTSYKYNKIIGTLAGSGSNSIFLNNTVAFDSLYPIISLNNGQFNQEIFINDYSQSVEDYDTISIPMWNGATSQDLYNLAIVEIIKRKNQYLYEFTINSRIFIKAGDKIKIEYHSQTLPLFLTATVRESMYDFETGFCKIMIADEPTIHTEGRNIWQVQQALDVVKEQQTSPQ
jgi:hypothetical protein